MIDNDSAQDKALAVHRGRHKVDWQTVNKILAGAVVTNGDAIPDFLHVVVRALDGVDVVLWIVNERLVAENACAAKAEAGPGDTRDSRRIVVVRGWIIPLMFLVGGLRFSVDVSAVVNS